MMIRHTRNGSLSLLTLTFLLAAPTARAEAASETRYLERPGGRIAYDDTGGDGPLVVCVPGLGDVRGVYRFLAPALAAAGYRLVTVDVRGHGESSTGWDDYGADAVGSDLVALIEALDAGPARIVGGSMASAAGVWAAAEAPDRVAALVLVGPFVRDVKMPPGLTLRMGIAITGPGAWSRWYRRLYPTSPPEDLEAYRKALAANLRERGRMKALRAMGMASKAECEARLPEVQAPTLVVMGTRDPDFADPEAEARHVAERLGGEVVLVEGAGHYPQAEMPEVTTPRILDFLRAVDAPAR